MSISTRICNILFSFSTCAVAALRSSRCFGVRALFICNTLGDIVSFSPEDVDRVMQWNAEFGDGILSCICILIGRRERGLCNRKLKKIVRSLFMPFRCDRLRRRERRQRIALRIHAFVHRNFNAGIWQSQCLQVGHTLTSGAHVFSGFCHLSSDRGTGGVCKKKDPEYILYLQLISA